MEMKEAYCSKEICELLRERGFDIEIPTYIDKYGNVGYGTYWNWNKSSHTIADSCPTHQMAMAWLREVHKLYVDVYIVKNYNNKTVEYCITIEDLNFPSSDDGIEIGPPHKSYEEACEAAIKYCLEKLI